MIGNYFKTSLRNLAKYKVFSFINITGLAAGMACCMLLLLFVKNELSYESFNTKAERIYRINTDFIQDGETQRYVVTSPMIAPTLKLEYPEISEAVRLVKRDKILIKNGDVSFYENDFYYADSNFFKVFDYNLQGSRTGALSDINSVVISKAKSLKYFGNENALGKTLTIELSGELKDYKVTGIINFEKGPSDVEPEFIVSFLNLGENTLSMWWAFGYNTYLLLNEGVSAASLEAKLPAFIDKHLPKMDWVTDLPVLTLQQLKEIHLNSDFLNKDGEMNPRSTLYLFLVLALFIITIACINFMNLATARSQARSKEVGVRKVIGAGRGQLIKQFLSESFIMAFLSLFISFLIVELLLPMFNNLAGKHITINYGSDYLAVGGFFVITILVGFIAGIYPALFLSRFRPVEVLKGKSSIKTGGAFLRKSLVIVQFAITGILILGTILIYSQLEFVKNKKLGFDKEHIITISYTGSELKKSSAAFKNELLKNSDIISATNSSAFPYDEFWWVTRVTKEGDRHADGKALYTFQVDFDFFKTLKTGFAAGRDFSKSLNSDSSRFIINEAAVKDFGWKSPEEAIGERVSWLGNGPENAKTGEIIGVVKDFNFKSLHEEIHPAVFHITADAPEFLALRIRPNSLSEVLPVIESKFKEFEKIHPFQFSFLDDNVNKQYESTTKLGSVFTTFSLLAILIACLGLFGLVSFTTEQRTKEIGIRKVLGASIPGIIFKLTKEFSKWVIIANVVAWPIAYYLMDKWLEDFAYKVDITIWMFILSGLCALIIALLTIGFQAIKAAAANPVKSLRYE